MGPISCSRNVNVVTMPKLPPPPRNAQNRSGFSVSDAVTMRPSAVTTSAATRLSQTKPSLRSSQPLPLPRARPAMPVVETRPPVMARPCSRGAAGGDGGAVSLRRGVELTPRQAAAGADRPGGGVDVYGLDAAQVDAESALDDLGAGDALATAVYRDLQLLLSRIAHGGGDVGSRAAPGDDGRPAVDHRVEHGARGVVRRVVWCDDGAGEVRHDDRCCLGHLAPHGGCSGNGSAAAGRDATAHSGRC